MVMSQWDDSRAGNTGQPYMARRPMCVETVRLNSCAAVRCNGFIIEKKRMFASI